MLALQKLNEHIRSGMPGALLPDDFAERFPQDKSRIVAVGGADSGVYEITSPVHGYHYTFDKDADTIWDRNGAEIPYGVEIDPTPYQDRDTNSEKVADVGHNQMSAMEMMQRAYSMTPQTAQEIADQQALIDQASRLADQIRGPELRSKGSRVQPVWGETRTGNPKVQIGVPEQIEYQTGVDKYGAQFHPETPTPDASTPASSLVGSQAYNDMVGVPAHAHGEVSDRDLDAPPTNGVSVNTYADGSEVHYRLQPVRKDPESGETSYKVMGFDVTVPHLKGVAGAEHTYSREHLKFKGEKRLTPIRLQHTLHGTGPDGETYSSDPRVHDINERGMPRYKEMSPRELERREREMSYGAFEELDDKAYQIDAKREQLLRGTSPTGGRNREKGLLDMVERGEIDALPQAMKDNYVRQAVAHFKDVPAGFELTSETAPDLVRMISESRARQQPVDIDQAAGRLIDKYSDLHPFAVHGKGFAPEPTLLDTPGYATTHMKKILGMARGIVERPRLYSGEQVSRAKDAMRDILEIAPTEPHRSGGVNWLGSIRNSLRRKMSPPEETAATEPQKRGRKAVPTLPPETPISVMGGSLKARHNTAQGKVHQAIPLDPYEHIDVHRASTIGELHEALRGVRVQREGGRSGTRPHGGKLLVKIHDENGGSRQTTLVANVERNEYREDSGEARRAKKATLAWGVHHEDVGVSKDPVTGFPRTFSTRAGAERHARELQEQGHPEGHVVFPLNPETKMPIASSVLPEEIGTENVPFRVHSTGTTPLAWGRAQGGAHESAVREYGRTVTAAKAKAHGALANQMLNPEAPKGFSPAPSASLADLAATTAILDRGRGR